MAYEKINWQNSPSTATPINDTNLKKMDDAIAEHDNDLLQRGRNLITDFGAIGDGIADDTEALNLLITALESGESVYVPANKTYRFTSTLSIKKIEIDFNGSILLKDFDGVGINIIGGGATFTILRNLNINAKDGTQILDTSHGIYIEDSRIIFDNVSSYFHSGCGIKYACIAGNCNHADIQAKCGFNGSHGFHFTGDGVDANRYKVDLYSYGNSGDGTLIDSDTKFWNGRIHGESNSGTTLNIKNGGYINLIVYLENGGVADYYIADRPFISLEGRLGTGSNLSGTTKLSNGGNVVVVNGSDATVSKVLANNLTVSASRYFTRQNIGSSSRLLTEEIVKGDGTHEIVGYNNGVTKDARVTVMGNQGIAELYGKNSVRLLTDGGNIKFFIGTGSPEGVVIANVGDIYISKSGGVGTTLYIKTASSGTSTGWTAK